MSEPDEKSFAAAIDDVEMEFGITRTPEQVAAIEKAASELQPMLNLVERVGSEQIDREIADGIARAAAPKSPNET